MKTALCLFFVILAGSSIAQVPATTDAVQVSPEVEAAHQFALEFLNLAFSEDYRDAEAMMNPNPPYKGMASNSEFAKARRAEIESLVKKRKERGATAEWTTTMKGHVHKWSERSQDEDFIDFSFKVSYPDGRSSFSQVTVLRRNGTMFIERFMQAPQKYFPWRKNRFDE